MATPTNTSAKLQSDSVNNANWNAGFTFTAGRQATLQVAAYPGNIPISSVTIGGTAATLINTTSSGGGTLAQTWFADNITGGNSTVAINTGGGGRYLTGVVTEWPAGTFDGVEAQNVATGTGTAPAASVTTANPSVLFATVACDDSTSNANYGGPSGWTAIATENDANNHSAMRAAWREDEASGSKTATFSSGNLTYGVSLVAMRLAAGVTVDVDLDVDGAFGASISGAAAAFGSLVGPGDFGASFSGRVSAKASMTAGFGAGTADGSVADAVASVAIPAELALAAAALRQASGAITAGQELGEAWASQAAAAALMVASGEFGAAFEATSSGSEDAAFTAGTEASASFISAAQAFGQLIPGATIGDLFVGIAQARGSVDASSSLSYVAAASVAMQVSIETGLELGEAWASHASAMADMASAGEFGISFTAETQAAQVGSFTAGTVAAAAFLSSISALGALVGVASFGMALQAVATAEADLEVVAYLGAVFGTGDMPPTPPIPPGRTVTVMARSRLIRIPSRSRTIRVH